jgi:hypothetical protein
VLYFYHLKANQGYLKFWDEEEAGKTKSRAKGAKVMGLGPSSRANARDLRKISPFGRNDKGLSLHAWRLGAINFLKVALFNNLQVRIYAKSLFAV